MLAHAQSEEFRALGQAFMMIIVSEIGDKTFLIAAILAMRHPRWTVFLGAFGSLVVMSILSAELGHLLPALFIPKRWTQGAAALLFFVFGARMFKEGLEMSSGSEKIQEELGEVELELAKVGDGADMVGGTPTTARMGDGLEEARVGGGMDTRGTGIKEGAANLAKLVFGPVFVQSFVLTFLAEWGDRSQIATVALGAAHNVYIVTLGTVIGHSACTALAVLGGRYISTKISVKHITLGGAALFVIFGIMYMYEAYNGEPLSLPEMPLGSLPGVGDAAEVLPGVAG
ncbi:vacuole protein [Calocera cornea HHB12733]|uniref:GDT1 family protein n=1 Tax=Calocera cornea HHB12733 TaxID=1353952 RepID=A0A165JIM0_9BASI|nr:vacuole protein [Calocera cornea HHB12733]